MITLNQKTQMLSFKLVYCAENNEEQNITTKVEKRAYDSNQIYGHSQLFRRHIDYIGTEIGTVQIYIQV